METGYQRGKIQDESMHYEHMKHDGSLPIIGVNTFLNPKGNEAVTIELARSTEEEKLSQIKRLREFNQQHGMQAEAALQRIRTAAINNQNIFVELVDAVRFCSLGQISNALYEVGGQYRRNM
ncbi:MAG: methylmalonyl-CoA mutase family protein, partial [Sedimenticola sp.]|nr:methylmalonyl-CoA mutase family protein [Sedimenticola sp.]